MEIIQQIAACFAERGDSQYGGEAVSQLEHALQCAALAESDQAPPTLIVAALLHDIGHLLHDLPNEAPDQGVDDQHEKRGYRFLDRHFGPAVTEPVRLHVDAKRYLCSVEPDYESQLSEPSRVSLQLQGGPMPPCELEEFRSSPFWADALRLRRWDDAAKVAEFTTPPLEHFLPMLRKSVRMT